eukprot:4521152-Pyramimonas_sp.AAC.1
MDVSKCTSCRSRTRDRRGTQNPRSGTRGRGPAPGTSKPETCHPAPARDPEPSRTKTRDPDSGPADP